MLFSTFQYFSRKRMYQNALNHIMQTTKFKETVNREYEEVRRRDPNMVILLFYYNTY